MKLTSRHIFSLITIAIATVAFLHPHHALAFATDTYAPSSVLSKGRWVKVSVSTTGIHFISNS